MSYEALSFALVLLAVLIAVTCYRDWQRQALLEETMEDLLGPERQAALDEILLIVAENQQALAACHDQAREIRGEGRAREAAEWMAHGCEAIEQLAPSFQAALRTLRRLARALSAITPLEPLGSYTFGVWRLRGLAAAGLVVHHLLLTGRERVLWRLRFLGAAFRLGVRWLRRSVERLSVNEAEWGHVERLVRDLHMVGDESVLTARRILLTLDALDRLRERTLAARAQRT